MQEETAEWEYTTEETAKSCPPCIDCIGHRAKPNTQPIRTMSSSSQEEAITAWFPALKYRSRRELLTTKREEQAIAIPANIGGRCTVG